MELNMTYGLKNDNVKQWAFCLACMIQQLK